MAGSEDQAGVGLSAAERAELFQIVFERSFKRGRFRLSSGVESELYFNIKPTMMSPRGARLSARAFLGVLDDLGAEYVGGLEMGAVPMLGAIAALGDLAGRPVGTFFLRKQAKDHGTRDTIEGLAPGESLEGRRVVIADDVATSGAAVFKTVEAVRAAGAKVDTGLVLVNREEGAAEFLAGHGVRLVSIFTAAEFLK